MKRRLLSISASLCLQACHAEPTPVALTSGSGVPYDTLLQTFRDGDSAEQPYRLLVRETGTQNTPKTVMFAEECKNVNVIPTKDTLYVFYDELILQEFSSSRYAPWKPRVRLCDLHFQDCSDAQRRLMQAGARQTSVCPFKAG